VTGDITRDDIQRAYQAIRPYLRRTPTVQVDVGPVTVTLKLEQLQCAGSFKARGAFTNLLLRQVPAAGVVAASGGNHGVAVAYAARRLGVPAKIYVPTVSAPAKIERIRQLGADLVVGGDRYADAYEAAQQWAATSGALSVHAFDQRETIVGQGTLALELAEQAPETDTVLVPVGGGGLIAGIAAWYDRRIKIIGVEPEGSPTLTRALAAGEPVDAEAGGIAADSLAPRRVGAQVFPIARQLVERVVLVSDDAIEQAQKILWSRLRIVAEPGGVAAFAALLSGRYQPLPNEHVGVLVSGGNTIAVRFEP